MVRRDAFKLLSRPPERHFDFIYVAPPQYRGVWHKCLRALERNAAWRRADTRVIVQIDPREYDAEQCFERLELVDQRRYGGTMLLFYRFVDAASRQRASALVAAAGSPLDNECGRLAGGLHDAGDLRLTQRRQQLAD